MRLPAESDPNESRYKLVVAVSLAVAILATPFGDFLTLTMTSHVLVQLPLLIASGYLAGLWLRDGYGRLFVRINAGGVPGILLVSFTIAFWMIPRWLDSSLVSPWVAYAKYGSLIFLAGVPLALSWNRLPMIARGVVKIELLSMLFRLGWLYIISPNRLCNNYLLNDQVLLGQWMLVIAVSLGLTWAIQPFLSTQRVRSPRVA